MRGDEDTVDGDQRERECGERVDRAFEWGRSPELRPVARRVAAAAEHLDVGPPLAAEAAIAAVVDRQRAASSAALLAAAARSPDPQPSPQSPRR
jgi:hypothetical protein